MNRRLVAILITIVVLPVAILAAVGVRLAQEERERLARRYDGLLDQRLADAAVSLDRIATGWERDLEALLAGVELDADSLRAVSRTHRFVVQVYRLDRDGALVHPPQVGRTATERAALARTDTLWAAGGLGSVMDPEAPAAGGWRTWFWGEGMQFLYRLHRDQSTLAAELSRSALLADLLAALPATAEEDGGETRMVLTDVRGRALYVWGGYVPAEGETPRVRRALAPPFDGWSLAAYGAVPAAALPQSAVLSVGAGVAAVALALTGLALFLYRESTRERREALLKVGFVGQVSHELKTPLTNIRLYAELLETRLAGADQGTRGHLAVIVAETQRLSRLIKNVLSFSRRDTGSRLRPAEGIVDDTVGAVITAFAPALEDAGLSAELSAGAPTPVLFDADAVEQIVSNLLSNVEKYAAGGGVLAVVTRQRDGWTAVEVSDRGPGVPREARERVFQPFFRLADRPTDGTAGTGIGLAIARDLARSHGGDLTVEDAEPGRRPPGARFVLRIPTPAAPTATSPSPADPTEPAQGGEG